MTGSYQIALESFMINPLRPHGHETVDLLNEMLIAHEKYLLQFTDAIKKIKKENGYA